MIEARIKIEQKGNKLEMEMVAKTNASTNKNEEARMKELYEVALEIIASHGGKGYTLERPDR